jgi:adenylate cyclase
MVRAAGPPAAFGASSTITSRSGPRTNVSLMSDVVRIEGVTRVRRTFAFVDVSGFTEFTDREGDAAAVELLETIRGSIRRLASVHGVRVAKWLGDGAMLVGVEPEPVIEAVVAMIEANREATALPLRAGVASGDVILFEGDDHIGQAVNLAARLSDLAGSDEILAPKSMMTSLLVNTQAFPAGEQQLPGIAAPLQLVRLEPAHD